MKTPEEYLKPYEKENDWTDEKYQHEDMIKAIKEAQRDAYNEALYDVTNKLVGILHDESDIDTVDLLYQKLNDLNN